MSDSKEISKGHLQEVNALEDQLIQHLKGQSVHICITALTELLCLSLTMADDHTRPQYIAVIDSELKTLLQFKKPVKETPHEQSENTKV